MAPLVTPAFLAISFNVVLAKPFCVKTVNAASISNSLVFSASFLVFRAILSSFNYLNELLGSIEGGLPKALQMIFSDPLNFF
jgi:hypothetical protein